MRLSEHTKEPTPYRPPERSDAGHAEPSATEAVERVLEAAQRLVTERIELAKLDVAEALTERVRRGVLILIPSLFAFGGWWLVMTAVAAFLNNYFTPAVSLSIVGGAHLVLGGGIALWAWTRGARP